MKEVLNRRIKHRETFRPFAPSILEEATGEYFEKTHPSPFMTFAYNVRPEKRAVIPAPTHVDGTARLQTVSRTANPLYWKLIRAFGDLTGVPVVLEHFVQRQRADRLPPRRSARLFSTHADGRAGDGQFRSGEKIRGRSKENPPPAAPRAQNSSDTKSQRGQRQPRPQPRGKITTRIHNLTRNAHPAPERILSARHFGHRENGRASRRSVGAAPSRHRRRRPALLRSRCALPLRPAPPRHAQQSHRRMRRFYRVPAPPDAARVLRTIFRTSRWPCRARWRFVRMLFSR